MVVGFGFVLVAVYFVGIDRRWSLVYEVDEVEVIERYGHGVKFLGRRPNT